MPTSLTTQKRISIATIGEKLFGKRQFDFERKITKKGQVCPKHL